MAVCIETAKRYNLDDYRTPVFIFERLCSIIYPVSTFAPDGLSFVFIFDFVIICLFLGSPVCRRRTK